MRKSSCIMIILMIILFSLSVFADEQAGPVNFQSMNEGTMYYFVTLEHDGYIGISRLANHIYLRQYGLDFSVNNIAFGDLVSPSYVELKAGIINGEAGFLNFGSAIKIEDEGESVRFIILKDDQRIGGSGEFGWTK